jgi:hypothetical protein
MANRPHTLHYLVCTHLAFDEHVRNEYLSNMEYLSAAEGSALALLRRLSDSKLQSAVVEGLDGNVKEMAKAIRKAANKKSKH